MPKVSIIVPVYNREARLGWCISSILAQKMRDFELILVDDGSTDGSLAICKNYAALDSRVRVIHQENGGVSSARNHGLAEAKGEYIQFVDSDDWIPPNMTGTLLDAIEKHEADLAICNLKNVYLKEQADPQTELLSSTRRKFPPVLDDEEFWNRLMFLFCETSLLENPCNRLYCTQTIQKRAIRFPEDMSYGEDCCFNLQAYDAVERVVFTSDAFYYHIEHSDDTLSTRYMENLFDNQMRQLDLMWELMEKRGVLNQENRTFWGTYCAAQTLKCLESLGSAQCRLSAKSKKKEIQKMVAHPKVQQAFLEAGYIPGPDKTLRRLVRKRNVQGLYRYITPGMLQQQEKKREKVQSKHLMRRALIKLMQAAQKMPFPSLKQAAQKVEYNLVAYGGKITCKKILKRLMNA